MSTLITSGHAGHGDPGASANGIIESDWTPILALRTEERLDGYEGRHEVFQLPGVGWLEDLQANIDYAVQEGFDFILALHIDKFTPNPEARGMCVYRYKGAPDMEPIQKVFHDTLAEFGREWGMPMRDMKTADFYELREAHNRGIKALLIECGFMSNSLDADLLKNYRFLDKLGNALAWANTEALDLKPRTAAKPDNYCPDCAKLFAELQAAKWDLKKVSGIAEPWMLK